MTIKTATIVLTALAGLQACGQDSNVDIGKGGGTGASLSDYADHWEGYTEARQFVIGSDRVRLQLNGDGTGTVVLGEDQAYPPVTDPSVGYPTNEDPTTTRVNAHKPRAGFAYPVHDVKVEAKRVRFNVWPNDFYAQWCHLQTPVESLSQPGVYFCGPDSVSMTSPGVCTGGDGHVIDCTKAQLCSTFICLCTASSCAAAESDDLAFDAALSDQGAALEGTFGGATVRMERK